jgi:hypothetical protein
MKYMLVKWTHHYDDMPVLIYSELDEDRYETRKVEIFHDGRKGYASEIEEFGSTGLSETEIPLISEIAEDPVLEPKEITQDEFEKVWLERDRK